MTLSQRCATGFVPLMARVILFAALLPMGWAHTFSQTTYSLAQTKQLAALGVTEAGMDWQTIQTTGFSTASAGSATVPEPTAPLQARTLYTIALASSSAGFPYPVLVAWLVALAELGGSLLLIAGAFARLSALSIVAVMVSAFIMTSLPALKETGWWSMPPSDYHRLFTHVSLCALAVTVALVGAGSLSVDGMLGSPQKHSRGGKESAGSKSKEPK